MFERLLGDPTTREDYRRDVGLEPKATVRTMPIPDSAYIRAMLRLRSTSEGGRRRAISSGYRPNCLIHLPEGIDQEYRDAVVYLEASETLMPGAEAIVRMQPAFPDYWNEIEVSSLIEVCEGARVVGVAEVVDLFPTGGPGIDP